MRPPDWQTDDGSCQLHLGECRDVLRQLPAESVQCCVTSPPYWGLRDYGHDDQIGLEKTPEDYVAKMVEVFREVRRVLRGDGTLWLNLGDSYAATKAERTRAQHGTENRPCAEATNLPSMKKPPELKPKDLVGIPWRVAFALQADGWWLRQDIIWHKPNPMPESVTDRCTKAHEYIFLLAKSERYYYDNEAVKEEARDWGSRDRLVGHAFTAGVMPNGSPHTGLRDGDFSSRGRNRRSVWTVATHPYDGAHFATYPPALIEPCILAGCQEGGTVLDPFNGSGTTGEVCIQHGRRYVGIELNPEYLELAKARLRKAVRKHATPLFAPPPRIVQRSLIDDGK